MLKKSVLPGLIVAASAALFMSSARFDLNAYVADQFGAASAFFLPTAAPAAVAVQAASPQIAEFPLIPAAAPRVAPLRDYASVGLTERLRVAILSRPDWAALYRTKRLSVGLVDLREETRPEFATLNGEHMMYAASLPKIAVLAAAHDAIERGELAETAEVRRDMRLMIAKSNNAATTRMIDRVGYENIERTMRDEQHTLYDPAHGGGLWVGKRYAAGGRRYPDPMKGISHAATTDQICRYFYLLANGQLVSEQSSSKMMDYLVDPELHHKFVSVLDRVAPRARVYRKSGSWSVYHADCALVQGPERNYIMTALVESEDGEQIIRELGAVMDELMLQPSAVQSAQ